MTHTAHRLNAIPTRTSGSFCVQTDKQIPKFIRNFKGSRLTNTIFKKKNKVERFTLFYFKTYHKATVIRTVWPWHRTDTQINATDAGSAEPAKKGLGHTA